MEQYEFWRLVGIDIAALITALIPVIVAIMLICSGIKCVLRSEMLRTYYKYVDSVEAGEVPTIRQYELENFILLYKAYKALKGNSFIDKIRNEVMTWKVIS